MAKLPIKTKGKYPTFSYPRVAGSTIFAKKYHIMTSRKVFKTLMPKSTLKVQSSSNWQMKLACTRFKKSVIPMSLTKGCGWRSIKGFLSEHLSLSNGNIRQHKYL